MKNDALTRALERLLRPMIGLLLARGATFQQIAPLIKRLFVEEAARRAAAAGEKPTDSRLSVLTGLQRRDVKALRGAALRSAPTSPTVGPAERVRALWTSDPDFLGPDGAPRPLPRRTDADDASFEALCRRATRDVHPRTLLDALLEAKSITIDAAEIVTLTDAEAERDDAALAYLGANLGAHAAAAARNIGLPRAERPFFERAVAFGGLTTEAAQELDALSRRLQQTVFDTLAAEARRLQARDDGAPKTTRLRAGAYVHYARPADETPPPG